MAKIKVRLINETTLELLEDGKCGDTIDIQELIEVDNTFILKSIEEGKDKIYKEKFNELEERLNANKELEITKIKSELNSLKAKEISEKDKAILELNNQIKSLIESRDLEIKNNKLKIESELNIKIENLNNELSTIISKKELEKEQTINKIKDEINKENDLKIVEKDKKIEQLLNSNMVLKEENSKLTLQKNSLGTKKLGEELENWCNETIQECKMYGFQNCTWEKANQPVEGKKPDYVFRIYQDKEKTIELSSVCLEMKNEGENGKTKNSMHYSKLDKDRQRYNCEYALLVSELEWNSENDSPIKVVDEYEKMYMVRPQYFVTFLSIIYSLAQKYKELMAEKKKEDENFAAKHEIIAEFEDLKAKYLDKPLNNLNDKISSIRKHADTIVNNAREIQNDVDEIINKSIVSMKEKIERFDIKKITRKIDKLEN